MGRKVKYYTVARYKISETMNSIQIYSNGVRKDVLYENYLCALFLKIF